MKSNDSAIKFRHPSIVCRFDGIIEFLLERINNPQMYIEESVYDAEHDLAILEDAGLYKRE